MKSDPSAFEYINRLKFATTLRYSTEHPPEGLLEENYFQNSAANYLHAGDEINCVCFHEDGSWTKGTLEVVESSSTKTVVALIDKWRQSGVSKSRSMKPVHKGFGKWSVVDSIGKTIASDLSKEEAFSMTSDKSAKAA